MLLLAPLQMWKLSSTITVSDEERTVLAAETVAASCSDFEVENSSCSMTGVFSLGIMSVAWRGRLCSGNLLNIRFSQDDLDSLDTCWDES